MKAQKATIKDLTERLKEKEMALNSANLQNTGLKDNEQELMRALATNEKNYEEFGHYNITYQENPFFCQFVTDLAINDKPNYCANE